MGGPNINTVDPGDTGIGQSLDVFNQMLGRVSGQGGFVEQALGGQGAQQAFQGALSQENLGAIQGAGNQLFGQQQALAGQLGRQQATDVLGQLGNQFANMGAGGTRSSAFANAASKGVTQALLAPQLQAAQQQAQFGQGLLGQQLGMGMQERGQALGLLGQMFGPVVGQKQVIAEEGMGSKLLNTGLQVGGMAAGAALMSDERLKENIIYYDTIDGYKLYKFNYIGEDEKDTHIGVIAQELGEDHEAVGVDSNGYYYVDYKLLPESVQKEVY